MANIENYTDFWMTVAELLDYLKIKRNTLYRWIRETDFPKPSKPSTHTAYWRKSEIDAWMDRQRKEI